MITNVSGSLLNTRILFSLCFLSLSPSQRGEPAKQNGVYNSISPFPPIGSCRAGRSDRLTRHCLPFVLNRRERERKAGLAFLPSVLSSSFMFSLQCHHGDRKERFRSCQKSHQVFYCVCPSRCLHTGQNVASAEVELAPWLSVTPQPCYFNWLPGC